MILKRIDKYILSEFWLPFVSGTGIITGVWLGIDKFKDVFGLLAKSGASFTTGFVVLGLEIPQILGTTIPISILLATFLAFQKLSGQSEVLAMRAAGVSFTRLMRPVFILGLLAAMACFFIAEFVVPFTTPVARKVYTLALYKDPISLSVSKGLSYFEKDNKGNIRRIFYVKKFKNNLLQDVVILDFSKDNLSLIHTAKEARWDPLKGGWLLFDGSSSYIKSAADKKKDTGSLGNESMHLVSNFKTTLIPSSVNPSELLKKLTKLNDLNFIGMYKFIKLHEGKKLYTDKLNEIKTKFYNKFSYPFSAVLMALIGACLGITGRRRVINWGYIALGLVVFVFYMSHTVFDSFGYSARLDPLVASWLPNLVLGSIAMVCFFYRANR